MTSTRWDRSAPNVAFLPFTAFDLLGTWSINYLNWDNVDGADHCTGGNCSDLITFNANQTAYMELIGAGLLAGK